MIIALSLLVAAGWLNEFFDSVGKREISRGRESIYMFGLLSYVWGVLLFFLLAWIKHRFVFSLGSLPTFLPRLILELLQAHIVIIAIVRADRSTFSFMRTLTIPLLLVVDVALGYPISISQSIGILAITLGLVALLANKKLDKKGLGFVIFSALNAVVTISLYKYNITHYNSVEAEEGIIQLFLLLYFIIWCYQKRSRTSLRLLLQPVAIAQSLAIGISSVLTSFAYLFGPASVITGVKRIIAVCFSVISGKIYFQERNFIWKLGAFIIVSLGLIAVSF